MLKIDVIRVKSLNVQYFKTVYLTKLLFTWLMQQAIRMLYIKFQVIQIILSNLIILTFSRYSGLLYLRGI